MIKRICNKCGNELIIYPGTNYDLRCQKCGNTRIDLSDSTVLNCGKCEKKYTAYKNFSALCCGSAIFSLNAPVTTNRNRARINCLRCDNKYYHPIGSKPERLTCPICGGEDINIRYQQKSSVVLKCICGKSSVVLTGEATKAYHNYPNCKRYELTILENTDLPIVKKDSVETISAIVICHNLLPITKRCISALRKSSIKLHQIILVDNASTDETQQWIQQQDDIAYIRNQVNLGCAIGRNQGAKFATGDYLFFVDNDQFVSIDDIEKLLNLKTDIAGVECWDVVSDDGFVGRSKQISGNSYIGAGGMLVKREVFENLKGFDERYAPAWYEDVDFSFRTRLGGYSMGVVANHGIEHLGNQTSGNQQDFDSSEAKKNSQLLFISLWKDYLNTYKNPSNSISPFVGKKKKNRPSILMIIDVLGWAWDNKSKQIQKYLSNEFDIKILTHKDISRGYCPEGFDIYFTYEVNFWKYISNAKGVRITGTTAHTYTNMSNWKRSLADADGIHANSRILEKELGQSLNRQVFYLPNGVDENVFNHTPINGNEFTVGYVGKDIKRKGVDILRKACEIADVKFVTQSCKHSDSNKLNHLDMPNFYKNISIIGVASDMDGTPNQLLEAAACGRGCVGNIIGNIPEFVKDRYNGFVVPERTPELYAEKFKWLKTHPKTVKLMGERARKVVEKKWTWEIMAENYRTMFREVL